MFFLASQLYCFVLFQPTTYLAPEAPPVVSVIISVSVIIPRVYDCVCIVSLVLPRPAQHPEHPVVAPPAPV